MRRLLLLILTSVSTVAAQGVTIQTHNPSPVYIDLPTQTYEVPAITHVIRVGDGGNTFSPEVVTAAVGDYLQWVFINGDHWIIRGDINYPCVPFEYLGVERTGLNSGMKLVDPNRFDESPSPYLVRVNRSEPIFFYSGAERDCIDHQMMGVVNPKGGVADLLEWKRKAEGLDFQLVPGEPWPNTATSTTTTTTSTDSSYSTITDDTSASTSTTGTANNPIVSPTPTRDPAAEEEGEKECNPQNDAAVIAACILGGLLGMILLVIACVWYIHKRRKCSDAAARKGYTSDMSPRARSPNRRSMGSGRTHGTDSMVGGLGPIPGPDEPIFGNFSNDSDDEDVQKPQEIGPQQRPLEGHPVQHPPCSIPPPRDYNPYSGDTAPNLPPSSRERCLTQQAAELGLNEPTKPPIELESPAIPGFTGQQGGLQTPRSLLTGSQR